MLWDILGNQIEMAGTTYMIVPMVRDKVSSLAASVFTSAIAASMYSGSDTSNLFHAALYASSVTQ